MYEHAFSDHYPGDLRKHSSGPSILLLLRLAQDCKSGDSYFISKLSGKHNQALRKSMFTLLHVFLNYPFLKDSSITEEFRSSFF